MSQSFYSKASIKEKFLKRTRGQRCIHTEQQIMMEADILSETVQRRQ